MTTNTHSPPGAGMSLVPELAIQQALKEEFRLLASDRERLLEIVQRVDDLRASTAAEWERDLREAAVRMLLPEHAGEGVRFGLGYPHDRAVMPFVSIVVGASPEDTSNAVMGNVQHRRCELQGDRLVEITTLGESYQTQVQVGSWTTAAEESLLLHALVRDALKGGEGRLAKAGILELSLADVGLEPDPDHFPATGYVPVWQCSIRWTRTTVRRRHVPHRYRLAGFQVSN